MCRPSPLMVLVGVLTCIFCAKLTNAGPVASPSSADEAGWSREVDGLTARLSLREREVLNGTPIFSTYLELRHSSGVANPIAVSWPGKSLKFEVVDGAGKNVAPSSAPYDGWIVDVPDLVIPYDSTIRINVSLSGEGVPPDQAALLDFGAEQSWVLPRNGGQYTLSAVLEIADGKAPIGKDSLRHWHGRIETPGIDILPRNEPADPVKLGQRISELGAAMLDKNQGLAGRAIHDLSLIDDERVIPWYIKAISTDSYELKFAALDRLCRFNGDEALAGLKAGMKTQGSNIGDCTTEAVAASMADNIRCKAADALTRSPNPQAKVLLFSMAGDSSTGVRIKIAQAAATLHSTDSLDVLKKLSEDADATVRSEAARCLKLRSEKK